jgi:hypothetical protein
MLSSPLLLILLATLLILLILGSLLILWKMLTEWRKTQEIQANLTETQLSLVSRAMNLLASGDVLAFERLQTSGTSVPSDEINTVGYEPEPLLTTRQWEEMYERVLRGEQLTDDERRRFDAYAGIDSVES